MTTLNKYALQLALVMAGLGLFALWPSLPAAQTPPLDPETIVLYAADAPRRQGAFEITPSSSAAGGQALLNPNQDLPRVDTALAAPGSYAELTFHAEAGKPYHLWIRGRAADNSARSDSIWMQFSGAISALNGPPLYRIGTTNAARLNLEEYDGAGLDGWGWVDNGYGVNVHGADIWFAQTGTQTVRLQPREDGLTIDQIVLSASMYLENAPGTPKNSPIILAKNDGSGSPEPPPVALCGSIPPNAPPALAWDAAQGATGYTVHFGTATGQYTTTVDVGNALQWAVPARPEWFISIRAYNSVGTSGYSAEVNTRGQ